MVGGLLPRQRRPYDALGVLGIVGFWSLGKGTTLVLAVAALGACSTTRSHVAPVAAAPENPARRICLVTNARVIGNFPDLYRAALEQRGYAVTVVTRNPQPSECPLTTRYTAFSELVLVDVYREGKPVGNGTLRGRYSQTDIQQLVDKLLP